MLNNALDKLQDIIEYKFKDLSLLKTAITHKSFAIEENSIQYYERLEFLGDSIISAITCAVLYKKFPALTEGELSKIKSQIVSAENVSVWASSINLGSFILLGKNEANLKCIRNNKNLLCDCFEALIGAIFIDGGFDNSMNLLKNFIESNQIYSNDYKSRLQEIAQRKYKMLPVYKVSKIFGPEHNKSFEVIVHIKDNCCGAGIGKTKKEAEQNAAQKAIDNIIASEI